MSTQIIEDMAWELILEISNLRLELDYAEKEIEETNREIRVLKLRLNNLCTIGFGGHDF